MEITVTQMQLKDIEQLKNCLTTEFDNFWTASILEQDFKNENS